jgi:hypothetical protein
LHRCLFLLRRWSGICRHPPLSSRCWWRLGYHGLGVGAWNVAGNDLQAQASRCPSVRTSRC